MALEFTNKGDSEWAVNFKPLFGNYMDAIRPMRNAVAAKQYCEKLRENGYEAEVVSRRVNPWKVVPTEKIDTWQDQAWTAWEEDGGR